ncbi:4-coumarate--CoA ligase 2-like [Neodiprion virginianus]|uniref:4-coumarate--CoA ligase 2-like n=1 Tax=Neodiprion virginianus TaxID=2961670 RepID=UPI001EE752BC|nr:4-coumarate--CoA ligase 2-like [Neodiprion virginianus]
MSLLRVTPYRNLSTLNHIIKNIFTTHNFPKNKNYGTASSVVKSTYEDISIPNQSVTSLVLSQKDHRAESPAVTCGVSGRSYTFGMTRMLIERGAAALIGQVGLKPGDRIGLILPNIPEYVIAIHSAMSAGLTVTFANPLYTEEEITRQFQSVGVKSIVTIPLLLETALQISKKLPNYTQTINIGGEPDPGKNVLSMQALLMDNDEVDLPKVNPTDIAVLPYSSGTTGPPKGVMLTHQNLVANIVQCSHHDFNDLPAFEGPQKTVFTVLPFFHIYGFNTIMNISLYRGEHLITIPRFTPEDYLSCLIKYKPDTLFVVPSLLLFLASHPEITADHLSSVKRVLSGAAPATKNLIDKFTEKLNRDDCVINQGYGMTETSPVTMLTPFRIEQSKAGSCGRLLPSTSARLVDQTNGEDITVPYKSGELLIKGPQLMKGYFNNPKATDETIDEEGWLHTGDVAYYDDAEYFFIVDRTKELIKVKGNQVSPTELESIILEMPGVVDVAVIGIPDTLAGELPRAFVVKQPNADLTEESISNYLKPKVVAYKNLAGGVIFINAIPRNAAGKIMRQELKVFGK